MTKKGCRVATAWILGLLGIGSTLAAEDAPKTEVPPAAPGPSAEHKLLLKDVGTWDATVKIWAEPGQEPHESKGVETNRMLGDLWVIQDFQGTMGGMAFAGNGQYGYDPVKKKYVGTWVDSMTPSIMSLEGVYEEGSRTLTMTGDVVDPASGKTARIRSVSRFPDDRTRVFSMYLEAPGGGEPFKMMEIIYRRRAEPASASPKGS